MSCRSLTARLDYRFCLSEYNSKALSTCLLRSISQQHSHLCFDYLREHECLYSNNTGVKVE